MLVIDICTSKFYVYYNRDVRKQKFSLFECMQVEKGVGTNNKGVFVYYI